AAGLVTIGGYNIQNIAEAAKPASPATEYRRWYQWYFHTERGRAGLAANRGPLCRLLWELWSPNYRFEDATYEATAASFDNPDFVEVVIQSSPTVTVTASRRATRHSMRSRRSSLANPRSRCRQSLCRVKP